MPTLPVAGGNLRRKQERGGWMMASLPVPAWVLYAGLAYPALLYEVLTDQSYAQHATLTTVREDAVRVAVCLAGWASLFIGLRVVPRALLPAWLAEGRRAPEGRFDTVHKPVNMLVSLIHSVVAVAVGCYLILPQLSSDDWRWHAPMASEHAWFIAMFVGYQIGDTTLGWAGQSAMHRVHHLAGLLAWGFPLVTRSQCTVVSVAYLLAEIANPFMHTRWCLKYLLRTMYMRYIRRYLHTHSTYKYRMCITRIRGRHWGKHSTVYGKLNEALCVLAWIFARNIPELYVCYHIYAMCVCRTCMYISIYVSYIYCTAQVCVLPPRVVRPAAPVDVARHCRGRKHADSGLDNTDVRSAHADGEGRKGRRSDGRAQERREGR